MKRLISTYTILLLFIVSSCNSPLSDSGKQSPQSVQSAVVPPATPFTLQGVQPDTLRTAVWQQFKEENGDQWRVRWNEHTGLPASVFSGLSKKAYRGGAEQAARSFLAEHAGLFGFSNLNNLKHMKTRTHRGIRHVTFNQTVKGVPVYEAEYKVHLRSNGKVDMANGDYYPNIEVSTNPSISKTAASGTAKSDLKLPAGQSLNTSSELMVFRVDEQFHLAWKLTLTSKKPVQNWLYFIDAGSGEVLHKANRLSSITGDGDIYPTHPGLSSVTNEDLFRLDNNGRLQGTYAYVLNDDGAEAYSTTNSFIYSPSNTHFDEVNLYYHVDRFRQNYINNITNSSLTFTQITVHAHGDHPTDGDRNAFYDPNNGDIYFGDGKSSSIHRDFAKEDKVIYHEYSHAVVDNVNSGVNTGDDEEGAISEGTPDYWAGSFVSRTLYGEYSVSSASRDMGDPFYDDYSDLPKNQQGDVDADGHLGGEFFSSILWDLRGEIGNGVLDPLVFDTFNRITNDPDFLEFRNCLMAADDAAYGGSHNDDIQNTFADKGVGTHVPPDVEITGPSTMAEGTTDTFTANVSGGHPPYSYQWYYRDQFQVGYTIATGATSSTYNHTAGSPPGQELKVLVTDTETSTFDLHSFTIFGQN